MSSYSCSRIAFKPVCCSQSYEPWASLVPRIDLSTSLRCFRLRLTNIESTFWTLPLNARKLSISTVSSMTSRYTICALISDFFGIMDASYRSCSKVISFLFPGTISHVVLLEKMSKLKVISKHETKHLKIFSFSLLLHYHVISFFEKIEVLDQIYFSLLLPHCYESEWVSYSEVNSMTIGITLPFTRTFISRWSLKRFVHQRLKILLQIRGFHASWTIIFPSGNCMLTEPNTTGSFPCQSSVYLTFSSDVRFRWSC